MLLSDDDDTFGVLWALGILSIGSTTEVIPQPMLSFDEWVVVVWLMLLFEFVVLLVMVDDCNDGAFNVIKRSSVTDNEREINNSGLVTWIVDDDDEEGLIWLNRLNQVFVLFWLFFFLAHEKSINPMIVSNRQ